MDEDDVVLYLDSVRSTIHQIWRLVTYLDTMLPRGMFVFVK